MSRDQTGRSAQPVAEPPVEGRSVPTGEPDVDQGRNRTGVVPGQAEQPQPVPPPDPPPTTGPDPKPGPKPDPKPDEDEDKAVVSDKDE